MDVAGIHHRFVHDRVGSHVMICIGVCHTEQGLLFLPNSYVCRTISESDRSWIHSQLDQSYHNCASYSKNLFLCLDDGDE